MTTNGVSVKAAATKKGAEMAIASLPRLIQDSLGFIAAYLLTPAVMFGRSGNRKRGMRSDRRQNLEAVLCVLLRACSFQHNGIFCHFTRFWVRPLSIPEIAKYLGICTKTVARCLADLVDLGLIECRQIKRKNPLTGQFEVSIGIRRFTDNFWKAIGQLEKYRQAEKWALEHGRRKFLCPFKAISVKAKETFKQAGEMVGDVLKTLSEGAMRAQFWCDKIRESIRQKK